MEINRGTEVGWDLEAQVGDDKLRDNVSDCVCACMHAGVGGGFWSCVTCLKFFLSTHAFRILISCLCLVHMKQKYSSINKNIVNLNLSTTASGKCNQYDDHINYWDVAFFQRKICATAFLLVTIHDNFLGFHMTEVKRKCNKHHPHFHP